LTAFVPERSSNTREQMHERVPQARIYRSWVVPGRALQARTNLDLAASVLGGGKNSRLYQALVYEAQLAVSVSASVEEHELTSIFRITATIKEDADVADVHNIIDDEVSRFLDDGPTKEELQRSQTTINAAFVRGVEQVGGFYGKATVLAKGELYAGDPAFYRTRLGWIDSATPSDVLDTSRTWLRKGYHQIDVLPYPTYTTTAADADRSALPVVDTTPDLTFPEIQRSELKNGIKIVLAERSTVPVVNIAMQFDAGYAADSGRKLGSAAFTLGMLDEGTEDRSALEISAEAEALGANINAGSDLDMSTVSLSALKSELAPSLNLFADIIKNPAFDQDEIDRMRPRILAGIEQEKNQPIGVALRALPPLLYGEDHAYGIPFTGSGTPDSVASISRDDMVQFQRDWLRPDNATIFVVGDVTMDEIKPLLEKQFGNWRAPGTPLPSKNLADVELPFEASVYLIDKPDAPQSLILAGHVAPPHGVENNIAIQTMNDSLGGQFTARVNMNLREDKGWAYGAYTFLWDARGQRPWMVYAPVQTDRTVDSLNELNKEFNEFLGDRPATQDELDRNVKNSVRSLPGQYQTANSVLDTLMANNRFGRPDDYAMTLKGKYENLTTDKLHDAAAEVIKPNKLTWLVVGDLSKIEQPIRDMGLGEVVVIEAQ
jgi:zinc protease